MVKRRHGSPPLLMSQLASPEMGKQRGNSSMDVKTCMVFGRDREYYIQIDPTRSVSKPDRGEIKGILVN